MTIRYELERYKSPDGNDFYVIALTGDTYEARDIIKGLGDFSFSDQVGYGKAWRSKIFLVANAANDKAEVHAIVNKMYNALKAAGYTIVRQ
jgi:hypothetical protein